jgi:hypothetical protein
LARVSASRKVQVVLASGTVSASPAPRKRMLKNDPRSDTRRARLTGRGWPEDQHLGHQHWIKRRPGRPLIGPSAARPVRDHPEQPKIRHRTQRLQLIALGREFLQALLNIKNPDRPRI